MNRRFKCILAGVAFAATTQSAVALDWSAEVYGGFAPDRRETLNDVDFDIDRGNVLGFGIYAEGVGPGLSVGLDVMSTRAQYTGFDTYVESLSLMAVLRKDFPIGQALQGYVSGGLGAIRNINEDVGERSSDTVAGAQAAIGLRRSLGASTKIFGELKYQTGLQDADLPGLFSATQSYSTTSVLVGLQFGF